MVIVEGWYQIWQIGIATKIMWRVETLQVGVNLEQKTLLVVELGRLFHKHALSAKSSRTEERPVALDLDEISNDSSHNLNAELSDDSSHNLSDNNE